VTGKLRAHTPKEKGHDHRLAGCFPPAVVERLMRASGLTLRELSKALDLSRRSLKRRRRSGKPAWYESDRLYRLARLLAIANEYLGNHSLARALARAAPIAPSAGGRRWRPSTRRSALAKLRIFLAESPTAESAESNLSAPAHRVCRKSLRRRRRLSLLPAAGRVRELGVSGSRHARIFRSPG
jgi:hypothetical protein